MDILRTASEVLALQYKKMKSRELQILSRLNRYDETLQLNPSEYEYCRFDAWSEKYIVEIKARNKYYKELMIEFDKYAFNSKYAENNGKEFLYINEMAGKLQEFLKENQLAVALAHQHKKCVNLHLNSIISIRIT